MKRLSVALIAVFSSAVMVQAQHGLQISLKNQSESEQQKKDQLERLLKQYDVTKWIFTKGILIDEKTRIPHSHPVLTLNTGDLEDDLATLATFIHEQIHWLEEAKGEKRERAIEELKMIYPNAPGGPPDGARDLYSTYLHLMVCYLEYEGMKELAGDEKARRLIEAKRYYRWVYRTVLTDGAKIKAVINKHEAGI